MSCNLKKVTVIDGQILDPVTGQAVWFDLKVKLEKTTAPLRKANLALKKLHLQLE